MLAHASCLLVTGLLSALTLTPLPATAIRVDWNTNPGPIVPPTPRPTVQPQPPFRAPAPVWEDLSNDIPDPHPFVYVLPPPSRPRPATSNYLTAERRPIASYYDYKSAFKYGKVVSPSELNAYLQSGGSRVVAALAPQYVPNVGLKYAAVVAGGGGATSSKYWAAAGGGDKAQGKYNAKTKKYKAYEKAKYVPLNYYPLFDLALPAEQAYVPEFDQTQLVLEQQLPLPQTPLPFAATAAATATATAPFGTAAPPPPLSTPGSIAAAAQPQPTQSRPESESQSPETHAAPVEPVSSTVTPSAKDTAPKQHDGSDQTLKQQQQQKQPPAKYESPNAIADADAKRS